MVFCFLLPPAHSFDGLYRGVLFILFQTLYSRVQNLRPHGGGRSIKVYAAMHMEFNLI